MTRTDPIGVRTATFSGRALQRARELRTVSKTQLSAHAGVTRQTIDDLERGATRDPSPPNLHRLAEALRVVPEFFYFEPGELPPAETVHLRTRVKAVPKKVTARLRAKAELFHRITLEFNRHVRFPSVDVPVYPSPDRRFTRYEIEDIAAECRRQWGVPQHSPIHNFTRLLERGGVLVGNVLDEHVAVQAFCWRSWRPLVFINRLSSDGKTAPVSRVRYDLGHELGHLILHDGQATGDRERETEANQFAGAFLLPRTPFQNEFRQRSARLDWEGLRAMKKRWGTSMQAIVRRAQDLGMVDERFVRNFYVQLSRNGWRRREPGEPEIDEEPEITRGIARALQERCDISPWELAQAVALSVDDFTEISGVPATAPNNVIDFGSRRHSRRVG